MIKYIGTPESAACNYSHLLHSSTPQSRVRTPWGVLDFPFPNIFFYLAQHYILLRRTEFSFLLLQTVTPSLESSLSCAQLELKVTFFPSQTPTSASLVLTRLRLVQRPHFSVLKSTYSRHPLSYKHHTFLSTQI